MTENLCRVRPIRGICRPQSCWWACLLFQIYHHHNHNHHHDRHHDCQHDHQHGEHVKGSGRAWHCREPSGHGRHTWAQEGQEVVMMVIVLVMMMMMMVLKIMVILIAQLTDGVWGYSSINVGLTVLVTIMIITIIVTIMIMAMAITIIIIRVPDGAWG